MWYPAVSAHIPQLHLVRGKVRGSEQKLNILRKKKSDSDYRKRKRNHGGSIREKGGRFYARVRYTGEDGKQRETVREAKNRSEARSLITQMRDELAKHGDASLDKHRMTFRDLAAAYTKTQLVPAIIVNGRKVGGLRSLQSAKDSLAVLISHFARRQVRGIKHSDVEAYKLLRFQTPVTIKRVKVTEVQGKKKRIETLESRPRSVASVNRELERMRAVMRFGQREGWLFKSPFETGATLISKASEVVRDRVLTIEEEARLLAACTTRRAHLQVFLICALDSAMRSGELFKLKWSEVDFAANLVQVLATNTKTERARMVGMTPRVREALFSVRAQAPPDYKGLVFGVSSVKTAFRGALADARIKGFRLHDCRHTAITRMVQSGMPAAEVMKISGHTQWTTFARYVNVNEQAARKGADLLAGHMARAVADSRAKIEAEALVSLGVN